MKIIDVILLAVILGIGVLAIWFICRSKKNGKKCIGCPDSCACSGGNCSGGCTGCKQ